MGLEIKLFFIFMLFIACIIAFCYYVGIANITKTNPKTNIQKFTTMKEAYSNTNQIINPNNKYSVIDSSAPQLIATIAPTQLPTQVPIGAQFIESAKQSNELTNQIMKSMPDELAALSLSSLPKMGL